METKGKGKERIRIRKIYIKIYTDLKIKKIKPNFQYYYQSQISYFYKNHIY